MAATGGPTVTLTFAGDDSPLKRTLKSVSASTGKLGKGLGSVGKGLGMIGAAGSAVTVLGGVAGAASQLAPAALLLPGALLAGAAAMQAFKLATSGFSDALSQMDDPKAFAEAIKDMAPAAQQTAIAIRNLNPQFKAMKKEVQGRFFEGFSRVVQSLGKTYLPILTENLSAIAGQMNIMGKAAANALLEPAAINDVNQIFNDTLETLRGMNGAVGDVISGFLGLGAVGSTFLPRLGTAIGNAADGFKDWVDGGVESGRITEMIDAAILAFKDLGAIVGNIGSVVASVFRGLGGSMESPLAGLAELTGRIAEFFRTVEAQEALSALGELMRAVGAVMGDIFLAALQAIVPVITALAPPITKVVEALGGALAPILPVIVNLIGKLAEAFAPVVEALAPVITQLGETLLPIIEQLAPIIADIAKSFGEALAAAIVAIAPLLPPLLDAFGRLLIALLPILPPLLDLAKELFPILGDILKNVIVPVLNILVPLFEKFGPIIADVITKIADFVRNAKEKFDEAKKKLEELRDKIQQKLAEIVTFFAELPGKITTAIGNFGTLLVNTGRDLLTGLWNGITGAAGWLRDRIAGFFGSLIPGWAKDFLGIGSPSKVFRDEVGKWIPEGLAAGIEGNLAPVTNASQEMASAALFSGQSAVPTTATPAAATGVAGQGVSVTFRGNTSDALAVVIMQMIRTGKIQIQ